MGGPVNLLVGMGQLDSVDAVGPWSREGASTAAGQHSRRVRRALQGHCQPARVDHCPPARSDTANAPLTPHILCCCYWLS